MMLLLHILDGRERIVEHISLIAHKETLFHAPVWKVFVLDAVDGLGRFVPGRKLDKTISDMLYITVGQILGVSSRRLICQIGQVHLNEADFGHRHCHLGIGDRKTEIIGIHAAGYQRVDRTKLLIQMVLSFILLRRLGAL